MILLEDDDVIANRIRIKSLAEDGEQVQLNNDEVAHWLAAEILK